MATEPVNIRLKVPDSEENRQKCYCRLCPSFPHDCSGEILFCGKNASRCGIKAQGCLCNRCPVYAEFGLQGLYYCDKVGVGESQILMRKKNSSEDAEFYQNLVNIKDQSMQGQSSVVSMGSQKKLPFSLDDLYFVPAQVNKTPLNQEEPVNTTVTIGPGSQKPLILSSPLLVSGMSFGAVSKNVRLVIGKTASLMKVGFNSGEGGIAPEEMDLATDYRVVQYATGRYGISDEILQKAAAVEIRFGQGAYPGKGSYLPAEKISEEIAQVRGLQPGEPSYSPAHHPDLRDNKSIKNKVSQIRKITAGSPIGAKIGCGDVEADVQVLAEAGVDFIALDGFGGGTGATDLYVRDNVGIPVFAAIPRALRTLQEMGVKEKISLLAGGNLHSSAEFAKCLALGADAIYMGTAALIAINCEQYRICNTGLCPTGVTTQNPKLTGQLDLEDGVSKLSNFIRLNTQEIANLTRIVGKSDVNRLDKEDVVSASKDLAQVVGVKWMNGEYL
jgi:methylamine---glutamate N-methyltransferase subunit C